MNQAINFFWTILCFIPVIICWYTANSLAPCYWFLALSLLCLFIPSRLLQLSNNPVFYTRAGIKFFRRFVQNGDYANRLIRKNKPEYTLIKSKRGALAYTKTLAMYQAYHLCCLVFFMLTMVYALINKYYLLGFMILLSNVVYNVYPVLLQQYNRARIKRINGRFQ